MNNDERVANFTPTLKVDGYVWFDDEHKWFTIPKPSFGSKIKNSYIFSYDELIDFDVLEDGDSLVEGGYDKALLGGMFFGLIGALAAGGGPKKVKQICTKLEIKIVTRNVDYPVLYIDLINKETEKNGTIYKNASGAAREITSKLQSIFNQLERS